MQINGKIHKVMENDNGTARHVSTTSKTNN